jgi:hypothetical protein
VTAHLPGLEIEIFTVGHRVDGEQISINVRAVYTGHEIFRSMSASSWTRSIDAAAR